MLKDKALYGLLKFINIIDILLHIRGNRWDPVFPLTIHVHFCLKFAHIAEGSTTEVVCGHLTGEVHLLWIAPFCVWWKINSKSDCDDK